MRNLENPSLNWKRLCVLLAFVLTAMIALLLSSCSPPRFLTTSYQSRDSIVVKQVVRDTTVVIKSDSSMIQALIECDSLGQAHIKELRKYQMGERLKPPIITIKDNILTATAYADSLEIKITWLEERLEYYKNNTQITTQYVEVNRLTWWQTLWVCVGRVGATFLVLLIIYKIIKRYVK